MHAHLSYVINYKLILKVYMHNVICNNIMQAQKLLNRLAERELYHEVELENDVTNTLNHDACMLIATIIIIIIGTTM